MQDKPHIGFVNTHAKGVCGYDDRRLVVDEIVLVGAADLGGQPGVVFGGGKAGLGQQLLQLIDIFAGGAVDDAALARMVAQVLQHKVVLAAGGLDLKIQVRAVKARHQHLGVLQPQCAAYILLHRPGRCGRKGREDRPPGQTVHKGKDLEVAGAEILPPLADTVRLVYCDHRKLGRCGKAAEGAALQPLGRDIEELVAALGGKGQCLVDLCLAQARVDEGSADTGVVQRLDLILHQRDQRGDDKSDARQQQGRDLIAERLACAGGHDGQCVPPGQNGVDDLLLPGTEGVVAEIAFERFKRCHGADASGLTGS